MRVISHAECHYHQQNEGTHLLRCHSAETASTSDRNLGSVRLLFEKWRICIQSEWSHPIYRNVGITHCNTNRRLFTVTQLQHTFQVPSNCGTPSHREPPPPTPTKARALHLSNQISNSPSCFYCRRPPSVWQDISAVPSYRRLLFI